MEDDAQLSMRLDPVLVEINEQRMNAVGTKQLSAWHFLKHNYSAAEAKIDPNIFRNAVISVITVLFRLLFTYS